MTSSLIGRTFLDVLRAALEGLDEYASIDDIDDAFMGEQTAVEFLDFAGRDRRSAIRRGLASLGRIKVGDAGYKEKPLFDADDYDEVVRSRVKAGTEFHQKARILAAECRGLHGVEIDVERYIAQAKSA